MSRRGRETQTKKEGDPLLEKLKTFAAPVKWVVGTVVSALVLIWFWHPLCGAVIAIAQKADKLFP